MIVFFYGAQPKQYEDLMSKMFVARAKLFIDRLGWDLTTDEQGREIDQYDAFNPLYVVATNERGDHIGSLRIMPTTGRHMTAEHFAHLSDVGEIRSPLIWEVTRYCVESSEKHGASNIRKASIELFLALNELGVYAGINQVIATFDPRMLPIYKRTGWAPEVIGGQGSGRGAIYLGLWDVNKASVAGLRARLGREKALCERDSMRSVLSAA